jgi:hypothetical protein
VDGEVRVTSASDHGRSQWRQANRDLDGGVGCGRPANAAVATFSAG